MTTNISFHSIINYTQLHMIFWSRKSLWILYLLKYEIFILTLIPWFLDVYEVVCFSLVLGFFWHMLLSLVLTLFFFSPNISHNLLWTFSLIFYFIINFILCLFGLVSNIRGHEQSHGLEQKHSSSVAWEKYLVGNLLRLLLFFFTAAKVV